MFKSFWPIRSRRSRSWHIGDAFVLVPLLIALVVALVAVVGHMSETWIITQVMRDPSTEFGFPFYGGFVSNIGIMGLITAAAVTGFTALVQQRAAPELVPVAALSLTLAIDDQYTLHETVLPGLGVPERLIFVAYGCALLWILWKLFSRRPSHSRAGLMLSLAAFALSAVVDLFFHSFSYYRLLLEDIAKFTGFMLWAGYWTAHSKALLQATLHDHRRGGIE